MLVRVQVLAAISSVRVGLAGFGFRLVKGLGWGGWFFSHKSVAGGGSVVFALGGVGSLRGWGGWVLRLWVEVVEEVGVRRERFHSSTTQLVDLSTDYSPRLLRLASS